MENKILLGIMAGSILVFAAATIYYHPKIFRMLFCRLGFGIAGIWGTNQCLRLLGISLAVGVNPLTMLILTVMGSPGLLLLYGIELYCKIFP